MNVRTSSRPRHLQMNWSLFWQIWIEWTLIGAGINALYIFYEFWRGWLK